MESEHTPIASTCETKPSVVQPSTADPIPTTPVRIRLPRWQRDLSGAYAIAATANDRSLHIQVEIETTDTQEVKGVLALLDSGATGNFIHPDFVKQHRLTTRPLSQPIRVNNVDGSPNDSGGVREVVDLVLRYKGHSERLTFAVICLGSQDMIIGLLWLKEHNPEIDWSSGEVKMSRCPQRCAHCREEVKVERKARIREHTRIQSC